MPSQIKRLVFDFRAIDYKSDVPSVEILDRLPDPASDKSHQPRNGKNFIQRWYLSLHGESAPIFSGTTVAPDGIAEQRIYRYDWTFGITLIKGFWWDWMADLSDLDSLAIHVLLQADDDAAEANPIAATLTAMHPARNTKGLLERMLPLLPKAATELAKVPAIPSALTSGLVLTADVIESYKEFQKNWFLYQFVDETLKCPAVEWRINKGILNEYGPLLRGSLFVTFHGSAESTPGKIRLELRPQVQYSRGGGLNFIVPTDKLAEEKRVIVDIHPKS